MGPEVALEREQEDAEEHGARLAASHGRLRLLLLHLAGPAVRARVDVEDLVQEVFLRALAVPAARRPGLEPGVLEAWLVTLARHTVIDVVRAARAAKRSGREEPLARSDWSRAGAVEPAARTPGPATRVQGGEAAERLARTWLALAPEHRRVIGLRQFEGLSAAEAARRMGRSEVAVHSLYRRALEAWERRLA